MRHLYNVTYCDIHCTQGGVGFRGSQLKAGSPLRRACNGTVPRQYMTKYQQQPSTNLACHQPIIWRRSAANRCDWTALFLGQADTILWCQFVITDFVLTSSVRLYQLDVAQAQQRSTVGHVKYLSQFNADWSNYFAIHSFTQSQFMTHPIQHPSTPFSTSHLVFELTVGVGRSGIPLLAFCPPPCSPFNSPLIPI